MKARLSERRLIASRFQVGGWSQAKLIKEGSCRKQVRLWKNVPCDAPDSAFADGQRSGRPKKFFKTKAAAKKMVKTHLEKDSARVVRLTAEKKKCSPSTIRRAAHTVAELKKPDSSIFLNANAEKKREEFCDARLGKDHSRTCWIDHTCLDIPPRPLTSQVWRLLDSEKEVPKIPRYKKRTSMQMLCAGCAEGISGPTFSAREVPCKRRRKGEAELGTRWETFKLDEHEVRRELKAIVLPFMKKHKLNVLDMDNAGVFIAQRDFLKEQKVDTVGFASLTIRDPDKGGHPPTSPDFMLQDAVIYPNFKHEWSRHCPMTIPEGITVAKKILRDLDRRNVCKKYVANYDKLLAEVKAKKGGKSHHLK